MSLVRRYVLSVSIFGLLMTFLGGCTAPQTNDQNTVDAALDAASSEALDPNSLQAINERQMAREQLPGRTHYDSACASCHEGALKRAPHRQMLLLMTPEAVLQALTTGLMSAQAASLTDTQKREVAEYLGGRSLGEVGKTYPRCDDKKRSTALAEKSANNLEVRTQNWGFTPDNKRYLPEGVTTLAADNAGRLKPSWAFAFNGANRARSQPLFVGDMLVTGSHNGEVLALDQKVGCVRWQFQAASEVRTAIVSDDPEKAGPQLFTLATCLAMFMR